MDTKKETVAILGYGGRGKIYASIIRRRVKSLKLVAIIDSNLEKLKVAEKLEKLDKDSLYSDYDKFLSQGKIAEWLCICTQDRLHFGHVMKALDAGYNILLEKPISPSIKECVEIEKKALALGRKVLVCHVLRYSSFYTQVKKIMDSKVLGDIISIEMQENVGYWHQAHSFVRGDWRIKNESAPMIMAKSCHDLDLAVYFANSPCKTLFSIGQLNQFKAEKAPVGASERCVDCKIKNCPYDAKDLYIKRFKRVPLYERPHVLPMSRLVPDAVPTVPKLQKAIRETRYGKCVYHCDNDVVDYQVVQMMFENGINCTLTMSGFSHDSTRDIHIRGSLGELVGQFEKRKIELYVYGKIKKTMWASWHPCGHGGGDIGIVKSMLADEPITEIKRSIESHIIAIASEDSRLKNGEMINMQEYWDKLEKDDIK